MQTSRTPIAGTRAPLAGTLTALAAGSLFGMLGPLTHYAAEAGVAGVAFTAWRALLGAAFVLVLLLVRRTFRAALGTVRDLPPRGKAAFALAAVMNTIVNMAIFTAFGLVPVAVALMILYLYPAGVVAVDVVTRREPLTRSRLAALFLSTGGVALVLFGGMSAGFHVDPVGVALSLLAAGCQVVYLMLNRGGYPSVASDTVVFGIQFAVFALASVVAVAIGQGAGLVAPLGSLAAWPWLLLAGVAAAGLSSVLFLTSIRTIGGARTGILMLIEPVVGVVLSAILLGEALGPVQALGGALVLVGALVLQFDSEPGLDPMGEPGAAGSR